MKIVSAEEMKALDALTIKETGISGRDLMLKAGAGAAGEILSYIKTSEIDQHVERFVILTGSGNNGGDGYVVADYLAKCNKVSVIIYSICSKKDLSCDASYYLDKLSDKTKVVFKKNITDSDFCSGDIIIDALLGTGLVGNLKTVYKAWIEAVNISGCPVISIDIPSGLNGTTGECETAIIADLTITMGLPKSGFFIKNGPRHVGLLKVVDIGIPEEFITKINSDIALFCNIDAKKLLKRIPNDSSKRTVGTVLIIGGSKYYKGAPILSGMAALRTGAGIVTLAVPKSCSPSTLPYNSLIFREVGDHNDGFFDQSSVSELLELIKSHDVIVIGPGIGTHHSTAKVVKSVLSCNRKIIIDADALNCIAYYLGIPKQREYFIYTPHAGELERILNAFETGGNIEEDRIVKVRKAVKLLKGTVVLKGSKTIVSSIGAEMLSINNSGSQALAKAGTGDVLGGIIGAFASSGLNNFEASRIAVYVHGLAGELAQRKNGTRGTIADDILEAIPTALKIISPFA